MSHEQHRTHGISCANPESKAKQFNPHPGLHIFCPTSHHVKSLSQFTCKGCKWTRLDFLSSIVARLVHDNFNRRLFVFLRPALVKAHDCRARLPDRRSSVTLRSNASQRCSFGRCQRLNRCFPLGRFVASTAATGRRVIIIHIVIHPPPPGKKTATVGFQ